MTALEFSAWLDGFLAAAGADLNDAQRAAIAARATAIRPARSSRGAAGGVARAASAARSGGRFTRAGVAGPAEPAEPAHDQQNELAGNDAGSLVQQVSRASESLSEIFSSSSEDQSPSQASDLVATARGSAREEAEAARLDLARELWAGGRELHASIAEQMPDVASESWPRKPVGPAKHLLAEVVLDLFELGGVAVARDIAIARSSRAAAEASSKRTLDWLTPTKFFGQWWQAIERPIAQPKSRGSPRAHAPPSTTSTEPVIPLEERAAVRADLARFLETHL